MIEVNQTTQPGEIDPTPFDGLLDDTIRDVQSLARRVDQLQAALDAIYAPIAKGVTNGDEHNHSGGDGGTINHDALSNTNPASSNHVTNGDGHDHNGGDGAQIAHGNLSSIGTNTHAQIDTHLALRRWTTILKSANESRASDTTFTTDNTLTATLLANKTYAVRGHIWYDTPAAADFKYRFAFAGTLLYVHVSADAPGATPSTDVITTTSPAEASLLGTGTVGGHISFDAICVTDGSNRAFNFLWAQNTSNAGNTTVLAGSYIEHCIAN